MSEDTTGKTVRYKYDPANPPSMTAEQMDRLRNMRDDEIDLSDIPQQAGEPGWHPARYSDGGAALRKAALRDRLLLLDPKIVEFFKDESEDAAARMTEVLREYVEAQRKTA